MVGASFLSRNAGTIHILPAYKSAVTHDTVINAQKPFPCYEGCGRSDSPQ